MSKQQHERPSAEAIDASRDRNAKDSGSPSSHNDGVPAQLRNAFKDGPGDKAQASIERATAVVGDDAGDAS